MASRSWGRLLASVAAVGTSYWLVHSGQAVRIDEPIERLVRRPMGRTADVAISSATDLGSVFGLAGVAAMLAVTGRRTAALDVAGAGTAAWVAAQAAKSLLDRPRPYEQTPDAERLVAIPAGSSWPSGHAAVASAIATVAGDHGRSAARFTGACLVGFVATSRIYVGVHHPTDPLAGAGIGVLSATLWQRLRRMAQRVLLRRRRRR